MRANLFEVFSGIQGEGIYLGRRQVFVRFAGCNLSCAYCDTPEARGPVASAQIERTPGGRDFEKVKNPVAASDLAAWVTRLDSDRRHDSISLTGGEPLLAPEFIAELVPLCEGRRFYLETNGSLPHELETVIRLIHTVAMDIKLPSSAGGVPDPEASREFLKTAAAADVFVKVVITGDTSADEIAKAARLVASVSEKTPFVIQPVTPTSAQTRAAAPTQTLDLQMSALGVLNDVRVLPQVHKLMGQK